MPIIFTPFFCLIFVPGAIKETVYPALARDKHCLAKILISVTGCTEVIWQIWIAFFEKLISGLSLGINF